MAKPQVYINLSQCLAIAGVSAIGLYYIKSVRDAVGIQKGQFKTRIKKDAEKVVGVFVYPFRRYF